MGCLCPRKSQYPTTNMQNRPYPANAPSTHHAFAMDSERNNILKVANNNNYQKTTAYLQQQYPSYPANQENISENRDSMEGKVGAGLLKSEILVSQIGGSKLQKSISIISTEADINSLEYSISSNRSLAQDMIVVAKDFKAKDKLKKIKKRFYSLIENKLYVKKDPTNLIKIRSPIQQLSLFCNSQTLKQTIHLTDGVPIENIKIVSSDPTTYLVENNFDVSIFLKLQCKKCNNKRMRLSSSCKLVLNFQCSCLSKQFTVLSLTTQPADIPIWYQGKKITSNPINYNTGRQLRAVGCNVCWRLDDCQKMECGCLRCSGCRWDHPNTKCMLCI